MINGIFWSTTDVLSQRFLKNMECSFVKFGEENKANKEQYIKCLLFKKKT